MPSSGKCQVVVWSRENRSESPVEATTSHFNGVEDWSADGKSLLITQFNDRTKRTEIWQLPIDPLGPEESSARKLASDPNHSLYQPHFSPDGKWIALEAVGDNQSIIYVMPAAGGPWTRITDGKQWDDKPRWSPDGRTIYYLSERKGFFNLWGSPFNPVSGRLHGEPFQITSFESPSLMIPKGISSVGISLGDNRVVLPLTQESGNIWILDNVDR